MIIYTVQCIDNVSCIEHTLRIYILLHIKKVLLYTLLLLVIKVSQPFTISFNPTSFLNSVTFAFSKHLIIGKDKFFPILYILFKLHISSLSDF